MAEGKHTAGALDRFDSIGHSIAFAEACLMHGADAATAKHAADDLHQALADVGAIRELAPAMLEALEGCMRVIARLTSPDMRDPASQVWAACVEAETKARTAISRANGGR